MPGFQRVHRRTDDEAFATLLITTLEKSLGHPLIKDQDDTWVAALGHVLRYVDAQDPDFATANHNSSDITVLINSGIVQDG